MSLLLVVLIAFFYLAPALLTGRVAAAKGHDGALWAYLGFFVGPLALLAAAVVPEVLTPRPKGRQEASGP